MKKIKPGNPAEKKLSTRGFPVLRPIAGPAMKQVVIIAKLSSKLSGQPDPAVPKNLRWEKNKRLALTLL